MDRASVILDPLNSFVLPGDRIRDESLPHAHGQYYSECHQKEPQPSALAFRLVNLLDHAVMLPQSKAAM